MSTSRLELYNDALLVCGERSLASLTENQESRFLLDQVWKNGRGIKYCLEQAQWHFAMNTVQLDYEPGITPPFGLRRAFTKPDDWVITSGVFEDEYQRDPLTQYADEVGYWYADRDLIYVKYVSDAVTFGLDLARWPETFTEYVAAYLASKIIRKLPGGAEKVIDICDDRKGVLHKALVKAKNKAAMTQPQTFPRRGSWVRARQAGKNGFHNDGGSQNNLIG
jgi:hypothetical protein